MKNKKKAWFAGAVTAVLFLLLVFFTLAGNSIYNWITPKVPVQRVNGTRILDRKEYVQISREALTDGNMIYIVTSSQGFSRTVYQIWKQEVEYIDEPYDESSVLVSTKLPGGCMVVTQPETAKELADGDQVLPKR